MVSIDLPPIARHADYYAGYLIPENLKDRWTLYRGTSKRVLPKLLSQLGKVDMFVHDSLHTYWNIRRELELISPYLSRPSIVIADDIQDNSAFLEWVKREQPTHWAAFREEWRDSLAGFAVFV